MAAKDKPTTGLIRQGHALAAQERTMSEDMTHEELQPAIEEPGECLVNDCPGHYNKKELLRIRAEQGILLTGSDDLVTCPRVEAQKKEYARGLQINHWFTRQKCDAEQLKAHERIRRAGHDFVLTMQDYAPECPDLDQAILRVREAVRYAIAANALQGR